MIKSADLKINKHSESLTILWENVSYRKSMDFQLNTNTPGKKVVISETNPLGKKPIFLLARGIVNILFKILYPNPINVWKGKFLFIKSFLAWWIMSVDIDDNREGKGVVTSESSAPKDHKPKPLESEQEDRSSINLDGPNSNTKEARASWMQPFDVKHRTYYNKDSPKKVYNKTFKGRCPPLRHMEKNTNNTENCKSTRIGKLDSRKWEKVPPDGYSPKGEN